MKQTPTTPRSASTPGEIFDCAWQAYKDRDWKTLHAIYAEDAELILPGAEPITGREEIVKTWRRLSDAFPDDGGDYSCVISHGDIAGGEKVYCGTNTGPLPIPGSATTLPPTGSHVSLAEADFITVGDGQIVKHTCYYDRLDYAAQLGIMSTE